MGWTICFDSKYRLPNGKADRRRNCDDMLTRAPKDANGNIIFDQRVLKSSLVGSTYYAAVERVYTADGARTVWASVFLTCGKSRRDGTVWGYKDMSEDCEPFYYDCPASILNLLTPTQNENAKHWREVCRATLAEKSKKAKTPDVRPPAGVTIEWGGGWVVSSPEYRAHSSYTGIRYFRTVSKKNALETFLKTYGTESQRKEYAEKPTMEKVKTKPEIIALPKGIKVRGSKYYWKFTREGDNISTLKAWRSQHPTKIEALHSAFRDNQVWFTDTETEEYYALYPDHRPQSESVA